MSRPCEAAGSFVVREEPPSRCADCPYPADGFLCRGRDGRCLRTELERMNRRERTKQPPAGQTSDGTCETACGLVSAAAEEGGDRNAAQP